MRDLIRPLGTLFALPLALMPLRAMAGPIAGYFSGGLFGLQWGATESQVRSAVPGGSLKTSAQNRTYTVTDGRVMLGINRDPPLDAESGYQPTDEERNAGRKVEFEFWGEGGLNAVLVHFPADDTYETLLAACTELFGKPPGSMNVQGLPLTAISYSWAMDNGFRLIIFHNQSDGNQQTTLLVVNTLIAPEDTARRGTSVCTIVLGGTACAGDGKQPVPAGAGKPGPPGRIESHRVQ